MRTYEFNRQFKSANRLGVITERSPELIVWEKHFFTSCALRTERRRRERKRTFSLNFCIILTCLYLALYRLELNNGHARLRGERNSLRALLWAKHEAEPHICASRCMTCPGIQPNRAISYSFICIDPLVVALTCIRNYTKAFGRNMYQCVSGFINASRSRSFARQLPPFPAFLAKCPSFGNATDYLLS